LKEKSKKGSAWSAKQSARILNLKENEDGRFEAVAEQS